MQFAFDRIRARGGDSGCQGVTFFAQAIFVVAQFRDEGSLIRQCRLKGVLSNILGTSQETLSRVLGKLSQEGLIEVQGKEISLLDPVKLQELAGGEIRL